MIKAKKIFRYTAVSTLAVGASLILGLLSFGGMLALWPALTAAFVVFGLSVAYEFEIYWQNLNNAWKKIVKPQSLLRQMGNEYLLKHCLSALEEENCPQFFSDYIANVEQHHLFEHRLLSEAEKAQKKQLEKTLSDREKWFARQLFSPRNTGLETNYQQELLDWLSQEGRQEELRHYQKRRTWLTAAMVFSLLSAVFMGIGTIYLLVEAFTSIPFLTTLSFAVWPFMIAPMALVAGMAYGLLTYNTFTDMICNNTLQNWYKNIKNDLQSEDPARYRHGLFMAIGAGLLATLAFTLTICTAGTWWTIVKESRPLFKWMAKMPQFIMGVINPIIIAISALAFNLQNTSETLDTLQELSRNNTQPQTDTMEIAEPAPGFVSSLWHEIKALFTRVSERENVAQIFNPFRLAHKLAVDPLRFILFIGHLFSIGITGDRLPGVPQIVSAIMGTISEGFEDWHYFFAHDHIHGHDRESLLKERLDASHGHDHSLDFPTRLIKLAFSILYVPAAFWDSGFSQLNRDPEKRLTFAQAFYKQIGLSDDNTLIDASQQEAQPTPISGSQAGEAMLAQSQSKKIQGSSCRGPNCKGPHHFNANTFKPSTVIRKRKKSVLPAISASTQENHPIKSWKVEHAIERIERFKEKYFSTIQSELLREKLEQLTSLQDCLRRIGSDNRSEIDTRLRDTLQLESRKEIYGQHRFFGNGKTRTQIFLEEEIWETIGLAKAAG